METKIAPASIQTINGQYCDGAGNQITNQAVLDTLPLEPQFVPEVLEESIAIPASEELPLYVFCGADLNKLDADLNHIGKFALPEDTYDYDNHQWDTVKGKQIGQALAEIEAEELAARRAQNQRDYWSTVEANRVYSEPGLNTSWLVK
jgi:hypothetical protein